MNTEWKNGYEAGFAAGWKAAKADTPNYQNYPPVYYNPIVGGTMADSVSTSTIGDVKTVLLNETKPIRNLTDHTLIV